MSGSARGGLGDDPVAPCKVVQSRAGHVQRDAVALGGPFGRGVLHEQSAYAQWLAGCRDRQSVIGLRCAGNHCPRGNDANATKRENAVHGEAECTVLDSGRISLAGPLQMCAQRIDAAAIGA